MPIRLSGMSSGLDTEALVSALVSGYTVQKDNLVKAQTKLSWKQEKWSTMNTKIYSFYTGSLSTARFSKNYNLKKAKISNSNYATVDASTSAVTGTQKLKVHELATSGYLTGGVISATTTDDSGTSSSTKVTGSTKLSDIEGIGTGSSGKLKIIAEGNTTDIELSSDMTVDNLVSKLKTAGVNASFDENNQRFFISSKTSGTEHEFELSAVDENGNTALNALGLSDTSRTDVKRIDAKDSKIELNGAIFTNNTNTYSINGLTITATALTGDNEVTITTENDVDGIYDSIKSFISDYNSLIKEIDTAYNAASAKGYEPLTSDEKSAMTDDQIKEWEDKIKTSLLRRDSTLSSISTMMKTTMNKSYTINGKSYSLSSFGIATQSYFSSSENEKGVLHIDGDSDDSTSKSNEDKLKAAIASDPDTVIEFFSKLANDLYTDLGKKMQGTSLRSTFKVYNDKEMAKEYSEYTTKISDKETEITTWEDYYYKKFSSMESALSKLNSQQSSLSGFFG